MTVAIVLRVAESDCKVYAGAWLSESELSGAQLGRFLAKGPLEQVLKRPAIDQVLVNLQVVRWPSAVRPDLGGHAEYLLFALQPQNGLGLELRPLDNTPALALLKNEKEREELKAWVAGNLEAIDKGTAVLPQKFLASRATSVTPRGFSRRANRLWRQIFAPTQVADLDLKNYPRLRTPEGLLRRLDDMTCVGCHQSRTIAGFHWLGVDGPKTAVGNALYLSRSVPLVAEAKRRDQLLLDIAAGKAVDFARPFAERAPDDAGGSGSRCGLGDPAFAAWTCAAGLQCIRYDSPADDKEVGICVSEGAPAVGEPCEVVPLKPHSNPRRDRGGRVPPRTCGVGVCNVNRVGFPGGMCTASCDDLPADGTCGVIALLTPFNSCLARKTPFPRCLAQHVAPAGLRACDAERPCRDDYICARTPDGKGACIPPYFLFQMRVDGHP
jgi:hypothetical protein